MARNKCESKRGANVFIFKLLKDKYSDSKKMLFRKKNKYVTQSIRKTPKYFKCYGLNRIL